MFLTSKRLCFLCPQLKSSLANIRLGYNAVFVAIRNYKSCLECSIPAAEAVAVKDLNIVEDFITEEEEKCLIKEIEPKWRRLKYQSGHWDNAIQDYRETEISKWSRQSDSIINRIRSVAFKDSDLQKTLVHILDLSADGYIKPHVDSVKFCGGVIAGLSLLSPCIMKFVKEDEPNMWIKALLKQRSLYIMSNSIRYNYSHEVLKNKDSMINGEHITKDRRISIICRSEPSPDMNSENIFQNVVIPLELGDENT
ncbi:alpha-ketoglutarate-dependent dioxygenase alkB homolog 7, mitochondrial-like [Clavelina lepadiformis]|uniref:Alpha-ketoglutarate-dependent dioxygenase AlkB-like domain-containing protein n=1 Tax=Clavelina lepadiformis TaxID=159417 RepID=A0ABP0FBX9_CLALP